jgi:OOP family OmpA-OmpF porin
MKKISTKNTLIGMILIPAMFSGSVLAQIIKFDQDPNVKKAEAYGVDDRGVVTRNSTGLCWHTGYWTPAMAIPECEPDLAKKVEVAVAPPPPPAPMPKKVTFSADALFDFDSAKLKSGGHGIQTLNEFAAGIKGVQYDRISVVGHADRIGSDSYNHKLSHRRADAVKAHLISQGIDPNKISASGRGETEPVTGNTCHGHGKALKECLAPDRRVDIDVEGLK